MILVVVVLVLMAVVGAAYLTVVRVDRMANRQLSDNIDVVLSSIIAEIQRELAEDIAFYDHENPANDLNHLAFSQGVAGVEPDEPYDFRGPATAWPTTGENEDPWLADFEPQGGTWRVSNLSKLNTAASPKRVEFERFVQFVDEKTEPTATITAQTVDARMAASNDPYFRQAADADADGMFDSRWKRAPLEKVSGVRYYFGLRIIDHGAMINCNVALRNDVAPRYWYPIDLDLAGGMVGGSAAEINGFINRRLQPKSGGQFPLSPYAARPLSRVDYWKFGPGVGFSDELVNLATGGNEQELRHRWGLNSDETAPVEENMAATFRTATAQSTWSSPTWQNDVRHRTTTMNGTSRLAGATWGVTAQTLFSLPSLWGRTAAQVDGARSQFAKLMMKDPDMPFYDGTPPAGLGSYQPPFGSADAADGTTRPWGDSRTAMAQYLASLVDYFDGDEMPEDTGQGYHGDFQPDRDSRISKIAVDQQGRVWSDLALNQAPPSGAIVRYGMEALPFITETYLQAAYWVTAAQDADPSDDQNNVYNITWTRSDQAGGANGIGYAIEIVNPWNSPVRNLGHIRLLVNGQNWGTLKTLVGNNVEHLDQSGGTKYAIILYRNSDGTTTSNDGDIKQAIDTWDSDVDSVVAKAHVVNPGKAMTIAGNGDDVVVELQVLVDDGQGVDPLNEPDGANDEWVTYCRMQRKNGDGATGPDSSDRLWLPTEVTKTGVDLGAGMEQNDKGAMLMANQGKDYERFIQRTALCDWGQGTGGSMNPTLNPIAVICTTGNNQMAAWGTDVGGNNGWSTEWEAPNLATKNPKGPNPTYGQIAKGDKDNAPSGQASQEAPDFVEPFTSAASPADYKYSFDDVALRYPTDLFRPMWVGPTGDDGVPANMTYAEMFSGNGGQVELTSPGAPGVLPPPPAAADDVLRKRMLTWTGDQVKQNGAGANRVLFRGQVLMDRVLAMSDAGSPIPGRFNLNTVPQNIFEGALNQVPNVGLIWAQLDTWRSSGGIRNGPGIASLGELLEMDTVMAANPVGYDGGGTQYPGLPSPLVKNYTSRAEEVRTAGYLMNTTTVRSDFFTAYIVIRGHRNDFLTAEESGQFIVVFDRSGVQNASATPRVVTLYRVK